MLDIIKWKKKLSAPWEKYYKKSDLKIKIPDVSIYEYFKEYAKMYKNYDAYSYFGKKATFATFLKQIDEAALAFMNQGIRQGDVVTLCLPNIPEAIICFYALNKIGAIANMIHPLSGEIEIKHYLISNNSVMLVMVDFCYEKVKNIIKDTKVYKTIVISVKESMPMLIGIGYTLTKGVKIKKPARSENYLYWKEFIIKSYRYHGDSKAVINKDTPAVILQSGGTTGMPKGIVLSNSSFNALVIQASIIFDGINAGDSVLAIMPVFHGFGLGVSIHLPLCRGLCLILEPQVDPRTFHKMVEKHKPNILFGVPTLYESLVEKSSNMDLSFLKYMVSGGDSLSLKSIRKINNYLKEHNSSIVLSQGYGLTESLAGVCFATKKSNKEGCIGIPLVGNHIKIVNPNTQDEVPYGEDGEICISGPTLMLGYLNDEKETNEILQIHKDGHLWLHSGDIGYMDVDGVLFYKQRLKRMIVTNGYNVYPAHIESVIEEHEAVLKCTVIGIYHKYKLEVPKAYIVLKNEYNPSIFLKVAIKEHCEKNLAKFAIPYEFEFRKSLPKTMIGKVDFIALQKEEEKNKEGK